VCKGIYFTPLRINYDSSGPLRLYFFLLSSLALPRLCSNNSCRRAEVDKGYHQHLWHGAGVCAQPGASGRITAPAHPPHRPFPAAARPSSGAKGISAPRGFHHPLATALPLRSRPPLPVRAAPSDLIALQQDLHDLATRSSQNLFVLDGVIPSPHSPTSRPGMFLDSLNECLLRLVARQLDAVVRATQSLILRTAALWQALGSPLRGFGQLSPGRASHSAR